MALILIVDDELSLTDFLEHALLDVGFEVMKAGDGVRALHIASVHHPDVVVTDFMMPMKTGLELTAEMRADPALRDIPAILTTGAQGAEVRGRADLFDAVFDKPYNLDSVVDVVRNLCEQNSQ